MSWFKFFLCGAIIAFCVFLGYLSAGKYRARKLFFGQFQQLNERYLAELSYLRRPLSVFLAEIRCEGEFGDMLRAFWKERIVRAEYSFLTADERRETGEYFSMMGRGDSLSQKNFFGAQKEKLEEKKSQSEREAKEQGELRLKLGLLAGLALVILIV